MHLHVSVIDLLAMDTRQLRSWMRALRFGGEYARDVRDLRAKLAEVLAAGVRYIPVGPPCAGFSLETGCPGHPAPAEVRS